MGATLEAALMTEFMPRAERGAVRKILRSNGLDLESRNLKITAATNMIITEADLSTQAPFVQIGKYSKRRRSNVAVIIVKIIFISVFLFYCLLLNHSFPTNPNRITNCLKLILFLITTLQTTFAQYVPSILNF